MRALLVGDVHLSDRPPSIRTETYTQDILAKLEYCIQRANAEAVDVVVQLGDMFDNKIPSRTSHQLVQAAANILTQAEMPVYIVVGNHDISYDRLDSLERQPLGTLFHLPNVRQLAGYVPEFDLIGVPYLDDPDHWSDYLQTARITSSTLVCLHAAIFPKAELPPYEAIAAETFSELLPEVRYVAYGHIHTSPRKGAYYRAGSAWFCNRGAISRGSLHGEHLSRVPGITLFDSEAEGCPFTSIDLPHKPAAEVFRLEQHRETLESRERVAGFLETMAGVQYGWLSKQEIRAHVLESLGVKTHPLVEDIFDAVD